MNPEHYGRLRELFDAAIEAPKAERRAFVEARTQGDPALLQEILALLEHHEDSARPVSISTRLHSTGAAASAEAGALPADGRLGHYQLLRELGGGGMGVVYLAHRNDDVFRKTVAVKIMRPGAVQGEYLERFRRERQILAGLDHPNIARILDGGDTPDGRAFYVMEYVDGPPLDKYCQRIGADRAMRVRLMLQVCAAVEYLHERAIVHRDLKPDNVLVTPDGRAKVLDFGIAGIQAPEGLVGSPGPAGSPTRILTPGFASPEQVEGCAASKRSDLYSLGVVLYHLLSGRLPFANASGQPDLARQLSDEEPAAPAASTPERPATRPAFSNADLDRVVLNALHRDPARRYESVRAFREDLERVLDGRPVTAHAPTWTYRVGKAVRRNRVPVALAGCLAVAALGASCLAIQMRVSQARLEAKEQDFDRILATLNREVDGWSDPTREVTVAQKTDVVKRAAGLLEDETLKKVAARGDKPQLVNRVVSGVEGVLSRAEQRAGGAVAVHKDVAIAYRVAGDFRLVLATTSGGRREDAVKSYGHAADAVREVSQVDAAWARATLDLLAARLGALGTRLDVTLYLQPEATVAAVAEPPPAPPRPAPRRIAVDEQLLREVRRELEWTTNNASRSRDSIAALSAQLAAGGQTLRADVSSNLAQVDMFIERARDELGAGELDSARSSLQRANHLLQRVKSAIGL